MRLEALARFAPLFLTLIISTAPLSARAGIAEEEKNPGSEEPKTSAPVVEETIVVTATRGEREITEVPLSTTVLIREEIEQAPALMIDDVIRSVPGVIPPPTSVLIHFPTNSAGRMRGLPGNSTLVMIDGVPINDPYQGFIQWNKVVVDAIDRIEVVRGANTSLFGNYAVGGTIQLLTNPVMDSGFRLRGLIGTDEMIQSNATLNYALNDRTGFSLTGAVIETDGYIRAIPEVRGAIDISNWYRSRNFQGRVDHRGESFFRTSARVAHFKDEKSQGTPMSFNASEITDIAVSGHRAIGSDGSLSLVGFMQHENLQIHLTSLNSTRDQESPGQDDNLDVDGLGGSIQLTRSPSPRVPFVTIGLDLQASEGSETSDSFRGPTPTVSEAGGKREIAGLFAQVSWQPRERLEVLTSARIDYLRHHAGFSVAANGAVTNHEANTTTEFDPRLTIRYELTNHSAIRGSVFRAFSAPEIRSLYRTPGGGRGRQVLPNPLLEPEITTGADMGLVASRGRAGGEVNLFWSRTIDTVNTTTLATEPILILKDVNLGESTARGVELIGRFEPSRHWRFMGGYVYTNTEITDNPADRSVEGNLLERIPERSLTASLRYRADNGFSGELRVRHQSETFLDAENVLRLDPFTIVDLSAHYALSDRLSVFLIGQNLFDKQYLGEITADRRLGEPRQLLAGFRLNQAFGR